MPYRTQAQRAVSSPDSRWLGRGCNSAAARVGVRLPERRICLSFPRRPSSVSCGQMDSCARRGLCLSLSRRLTCIPDDEHQIIRIPSPAGARHPAWGQQAIERGEKEEGFRPSSSSAASANQVPRQPLLFSRINEFIPRPIYSSLSGAAPVKQAIKKSPTELSRRRRTHRQWADQNGRFVENGRTTSPGPTRVRHRRNTALIRDLRSSLEASPGGVVPAEELCVHAGADRFHFMALTPVDNPGKADDLDRCGHQGTSFDSRGCSFPDLREGV